MKACMVMLVFLAFAPMAAQGSPVSKVFEMLSDLQAKIIKEGESSQKTYDEFSEWCEDRSKNVAFEIKTGKAETADLSATIEKETATQAALSTKIEELSGSIAGDEADLAAATKIRNEEKADFAAEEKESTEVIGMLERAVAILEREMKKGGAAMVQVQSAKSVVDAISAMVQASVISSADSKRLAALVQSSQEDSEDELGAPAAAVYQGHSDGIVGTLEDLLEKAEAQLDKARKAEQTSTHNYEMLKQSLTDEISFANKDLDSAKKGKAASEEGKAVAQGDLAVTTKDLDEDSTTLKTLHQDCMTGADDFQSETSSRAEELKALAAAKKVLQEALGGAAAQTYSFVQVLSSSSSRLSTGADLANLEAVRFIRDLARKENSKSLAQLASRMASAVSFATAGGANPFEKVKGLITDMISQLESDAQGDASHKAYCDKETFEANDKKANLKALIDKLSTQIDSKNAKSAKLKEEVASLQNQLAQLASSQAEMNKIRSEEKALYTTNHAEMKQGIDGVQKALSVLKDYYASDGKSHSSADGAGSGIIGMLEVIESDFSKGLAEMEVTESTAATDFDRVSKQNEIARTMKSQDVKYKNKEAAGLAKSVSEASSDLESTQAELDAVLEGLAKLDKMCVAKAEPYAEKKARRESELAGLKEALSILEGEAVLIQQTSKHALRGSQ